MITRVNPHDMGVHEYRGLDEDINSFVPQAVIDLVKQANAGDRDAADMVYDLGVNSISLHPIALEEIPNGSSFYAMDTGELYFFDEDNQEWITSSGSIEPVIGDDSGGGVS